MIHVFYCTCPEKSDVDLYNYLLSKIPAVFQNEISRFRNLEDRLHRVFGKLLLVKGLEILGISGYTLDQLNFTNLKRPYFDESIDFNISHSGKCVVCAISTSAKIGVDIEEIKDIPLTDFTDQFSAGEMKNIVNAENSLRSFYGLWTKKEAFLKAIGKGLYVPLNKVQVIDNKIKWKKSDWFLTELILNKDYCAHVCTNTHETGLQLYEITPQELYLN